MNSPLGLGPLPESDLHIAPASLPDLPALVDILIHSFYQDTLLQRWAEPLLRIAIQEDLRQRLQGQDKPYLCLLARTGAGVAGTAELTLPSRFLSGDRYPYVSNLAVHKRYRRQGVARALLSACETAVQTWGFPRIYLHVMEDNRPACQLYGGAGYRLASQGQSWLGSWLCHRPRRLLLTKTLKLNPGST